MLNRWYIFYWIILGVLFSTSTYATVFEVTPVQLSLSSKQMIGVLKVTNRSEKDSFLQLSLVSWQQRCGKDIYKTSHDILMTPPLFRLPAHKTQVIRFALKRPVLAMVQQTYRMHIKEIDRGKHNRMGQQLYFLMDFSLPLFIQPQHIEEQFIWSIQYPDPKHIKLKVYNDGNITLFINQWQLINNPKNLMIAKQATFAYILPGQSHSWLVAINSNSKPTDIESTINGQTKKSVLHKL
ncbi:MAG: fimbria/pilus periplasmic chaperone [Rickettsiella sp.]|nr:fimbria/pilus periplasmic chaperone [Rickettsiella sp.]